jgi:hypothetical protein
VKKDPTYLFFGTALLLVALSYVEFVASVHSYCEDRWQMAVLAISGLVVAALAIRNWPTTLARKLSLALTIMLSLVVTGENIWYFSWATHACRHMFDQLNPGLN